MKPESIRAQISSLNDELKDTLKEVNARHGERDLLLIQLEDLAEQREKEEESLQRIRDSIKSIQLSYEQQLKIINGQREERQAEVDQLSVYCRNLETKEANLREKIAELKEDKAKLATIRTELQEAERNRPLIESIKNELLRAIDALNEAKAELDIVTRQAERTKNESKQERDEHLSWMATTRNKIKLDNEGSVQLRLEWEKKLKDLIIVERRLKKLWEQTSKLPFPKIHNAGVITRN